MSWFEKQLWLSLAYYHLVLPHSSLRQPLVPARAQATTGLDKWALWQAGPNLRGANIYQRRSYPDVDGGLAAVGPVLPRPGTTFFCRWG